MVSEEIELYAAVEAPAVLRIVRNMNQHLTPFLGRASEAQLNRIKLVRKQADYRQLVTQKVQALNAVAAAPTAPSTEDEEEDEQQFFSAESDNYVEGTALQSKAVRSPLNLNGMVPLVP